MTVAEIEQKILEKRESLSCAYGRLRDAKYDVAKYKAEILALDKQLSKQRTADLRAELRAGK